MHPLLFGFLVVGPWWLPILQMKVGWGDPNTGPTAAGVAGLPTRNQTRHLPTWDKTRSSSARFQDNFLRFQVLLDAGLPQLSRISHTGLRSPPPPTPPGNECLWLSMKPAQPISPIQPAAEQKSNSAQTWQLTTGREEARRARPGP